MCNYSQHNVAFRPAERGDRPITTKFDNTLTGGFAAEVAVCVLPGMEIAFEKEAEIMHPFAGLLPKSHLGKLGAQVARFRQVNLPKPYAHRDAPEFPNGKIVLLNEPRPGLHAGVLQSPVLQTPARSAATRCTAFG
jgi:hypothetical protein